MKILVMIDQGCNPPGANVVKLQENEDIYVCYCRWFRDSNLNENDEWYDEDFANQIRDLTDDEILSDYCDVYLLEEEIQT